MLYKGRVQYCIHLTEKKDRSQEILEVLETGPKGFNEIHLKLSGNHTSLRANLTRLMDRGQIIQNDSNKIKNFNLYKKIKLLLRYEIIKNLKKTFNKKLILVGDDWKSLSFDIYPSNYYMKQINKLYSGNICLDLGSIEGSMSLYSRPNRIIESGGLIIQSIQNDSKEIWKNLRNKILFNNIPELMSLVEELLNNKKYCSTLLQEIYENFGHSEKSIEKSLDKIFNILN